MTDMPETVDLKWIARQLVAFREETQLDLRGLHEDVRTLREDMDVMSVIVRRIDRNQAALRDDVRQLFEMYRDLRRRIETLEGQP